MFSQVDEIGPLTYTLITCQVFKNSKPKTQSTTHGDLLEGLLTGSGGVI
jgi:hypothetical protein